MKYIDEYRKKESINILIERIHMEAKGSYSFMEVCGGHTMAIHRFGIPALLPKNIQLLSGPGCPVCVTGKEFIDKAVEYANNPGFIITTFGDLIKVPGSQTSLENKVAEGKDVRIVYSMLEALDVARNNPSKTIVFLAIGFETTAPGTAVGILEAKEMGQKNFMILSAHKTMPPAMDAIANEDVGINGYICPGHVSTITGAGIYEDLPTKYGLGCVISGFEPADILQSIFMLMKQVNNSKPVIEIQYRRAVKPGGNKKAKQYIAEVFQERDDRWRGLGIIKNSGLGLKQEFKDFDADYRYPVKTGTPTEDLDCICGEILQGKKRPVDCQLFAKQCTPANPVGACMVSGEGACQAYFKYKAYG